MLMKSVLSPCIVAACLLPACAPTMTMGHFTTYQTAQTAPPGRVITGAGVGMLKGSLMGSNTLVAFSPEGWMRYGVGERGEVGFRVYPVGLSLEGKALLYSGGEAAVAIIPGIGYSRSESYPFGITGGSPTMWSVLGSLPLIISIPIEGGHALYLGPKVMYEYLIAGDNSAATTYIGAVFGVAIRSGRVSVMPEINLFQYTALVTTVVTTYDSYGPSTRRVTNTMSGDIIFPGVGISVAF